MAELHEAARLVEDGLCEIAFSTPQEIIRERQQELEQAPTQEQSHDRGHDIER